MNQKPKSREVLAIWAAFLQTLVENKNQYLSTIALKRMGYQHPSQYIRYLKSNKHKSIRTIRRSVVDANGDLHKGIALYRLNTEV